MQPYQHFTLEERESLWFKRQEKKSIRQIAREMKRNPSSISRELKRNGKKEGSYNAWWGCSLYIWRRKKCGRKSRIGQDEKLRQFICEGLNRFWSPEIIAAKWNETNPGEKITYSSIYNALKKDLIEGYSRKKHLRRQGKKKYIRGSSAAIHPEHRIGDRPNEIDERKRIGDWEGDTILGGLNKGGLISLVDRKSRYLILSLIQNKSAKETKQILCNSLKDKPVLSITLDNGCEFAGFKDIEKQLNTTIYFAEPHSPWQRGSNENINGLVRWFFPKGFDFRTVTQEQVDIVTDIINNRPRKCLGWLTPLDLFRCCT